MLAGNERQHQCLVRGRRIKWRRRTDDQSVDDRRQQTLTVSTQGAQQSDGCHSRWDGLHEVCETAALRGAHCAARSATHAEGATATCLHATTEPPNNALTQAASMCEHAEELQRSVEGGLRTFRWCGQREALNHIACAHEGDGNSIAADTAIHLPPLERIRRQSEVSHQRDVVLVNALAEGTGGDEHARLVVRAPQAQALRALLKRHPVRAVRHSLAAVGGEKGGKRADVQRLGHVENPAPLADMLRHGAPQQLPAGEHEQTVRARLGHRDLQQRDRLAVDGATQHDAVLGETQALAHLPLERGRQRPRKSQYLEAVLVPVHLHHHLQPLHSGPSEEARFPERCLRNFVAGMRLIEDDTPDAAALGQGFAQQLASLGLEERVGRYDQQREMRVFADLPLGRRRGKVLQATRTLDIGACGGGGDGGVGAAVAAPRRFAGRRRVQPHLASHEALAHLAPAAALARALFAPAPRAPLRLATVGPLHTAAPVALANALRLALIALAARDGQRGAAGGRRNIVVGNSSGGGGGGGSRARRRGGASVEHLRLHGDQPTLERPPEVLGSLSLLVIAERHPRRYQHCELWQLAQATCFGHVGCRERRVRCPAGPPVGERGQLVGQALATACFLPAEHISST